MQRAPRFVHHGLVLVRRHPMRRSRDEAVVARARRAAQRLAVVNDACVIVRGAGQPAELPAARRELLVQVGRRLRQLVLRLFEQLFDLPAAEALLVVLVRQVDRWLSLLRVQVAPVTVLWRWTTAIVFVRIVVAALLVSFHFYQLSIN